MKKENNIAISQADCQVYENLPSACHILNNDFRIIFTNNEWEKLYGYPFSEVDGILFSDLLIDISPVAFKALISNLDAEGSAHDIELNVKKRNGSILNIKISSKLLIGVNPDFPSYIILSYNNSDQESLKKKIKKREEEAKLIFENVQGAIFQLKMEPDGTISFPYIVGSLEKIYGIVGADQQNQDVTFKNAIHPSDLDRILESMKISGNTLSLFHEEFRTIAPDGTILFIEGNAAPVKQNDGSVIYYGNLRDITDVKIRNEKFRKLSEAVEQSSASILLTDIDGNIEYVNKKFQEITGYLFEEVIGKNPRIFRSDETSKETYKELWQTITSGRTWTGEFLNIKKNGDKYWENAIISPVMDDSQKILGYVAIKEDITYRKKVEETLRESEEKYRGLIENMQEGLVVVNNDNIIWFINRKFCDLLGYEEIDIIGNSLAKFLATPADIQRVIEKRKNRIQGIIEEYELSILNSRGEHRFLHISATPIFNSDGIVTGSSATCLDITEGKLAEDALKKSEDKYKRIFESITDLYYQTDENGILTVVSPSIKRTSGWTAEEVLGKSVSEIYFDSSERNRLIATLTLNGYVNDYEILLVHRDGKPREVALSARMLFDENGKFNGVSGIIRDITDRKKSEKEIIRHQALLSSLLNSIPDLIFYKDSSGVYLGANQSFLNYIGKKNEEIIGKNDYELFEKSRADIFDRSDKESIISQKPVSFAEWTNYTDGNRVYLETLKTPYWDSNGNLLGILGISRDLTEHKNILEALKESEEFQKTLLENLTSGVMIIDEESKLIENLNPESEKLLGAASSEIIGDHCSKYLYEDQNRIDSTNSDNRTPEKCETILRSKDGSSIPIFRSIKSITIKERKKNLVNFIDITEIKKLQEELIKSEELYRLLAENVTDVIWVLDPKTFKFNYISPSIYKLCGFTVEETMTQPIEMTIAKESIEYMRNVLSDRITEYYFDGGLIKTYSDELIQICKDGTRIDVETTSTFIPNSEKEISAIIGVSRSIQQRKESERQLSKYTTELKELNSTKDKFFSIIAHDLRNPFSVIIGFIDLLKENYSRYDDSKRIEMIDMLKSSSQKAYTLLENLLTWSRSQTNKILFTPVINNLEEIISLCIEDVKSQAEKKDQRILLALNAENEIILDKNLITVVIRNLLTNAIKFTHRSGLIRVITLNKGAITEITIEDSGVGIPQENLEKLFEIDAKVSSAGTEGEPSSGLGLILCKEFVEKHGGKLWAESEVGKGSRFIFTIPKY
jgi:PAS domain S-box-containing protein